MQHKKQQSTPLTNPPSSNGLGVQPNKIMNIIADIKQKKPEEKQPPKLIENRKPDVNLKSPSDYKKPNIRDNEEAKGGIISIGFNDQKKKDQKEINDFMAKKLEQKK
jgi:hypothetical protein